MLLSNAMEFQGPARRFSDQEIFSAVVQRVQQLGYDSCLTFVYDESSGTFQPGPRSPNLQHQTYDTSLFMRPLSSSLAHALTENGMIVFGQDDTYSSDEYFSELLRDFQALWYVPIYLNERLYGVFVVMHVSKRKLLTPDETALKDVVYEAATLLSQSRFQHTSELYHSLFVHHPFGALRLDAHEVVMEVNDSFASFVGQPSGQLVGRPFAQVLRYIDLTPENIQWNKNVTYTIPHADGQTRSILWLSVPAVVDDKPSGRYVVLRDVSELLHMKRELRTTQDMLASFVQHSSDAIMLMNADGQILGVNPAFENMFGWAQADVAGLYVGNLAGVDLTHISRDELGAYTSRHVSYETRAATRDARYLDVEVSISLLLEDGIVSGSVAVVRDITSRKRSEYLLRQSEQRYYSLVHHNPNGILAVDIEGRVIEANDVFRRMTGKKLEDLREIPHFGELFTPKSQDRLNEWLSLARSGQRTMFGDTEELQLQHDSGLRVPVTMTHVPMITGAEQVEGLFFILEDITERKQAEEFLRLSDKLSGVGQLAAGVAHEIRNPLTAIRGFCKLMERDVSVSNQNYLKIMQSEIGRIELILREMMALAKPTVPMFKPILLQSMIEEIVALMTPEALLHDVMLYSDMPKETVQFQGDENQVKQVLVNVIKNGVQAIQGTGSVQVHAVVVQNKWIDISVMDTGVGIAKEELAKLGQPFYTTKAKGTGLGILVSRRIVEAHGGSLCIESRVGTGTTVRLRFPVAGPRTL